MSPKEHQARWHRRLAEVWKRIPLTGSLVVAVFVLAFVSFANPLLPLVGVVPLAPGDRQFVFTSSVVCLLFDMIGAVFNLRVIPRCQDLIAAWGARTPPAPKPKYPFSILGAEQHADVEQKFAKVAKNTMESLRPLRPSVQRLPHRETADVSRSPATSN